MPRKSTKGAASAAPALSPGEQIKAARPGTGCVAVRSDSGLLLLQEAALMVAKPEPDIPPGPYFSSCGPAHGYLLARFSAVMGVLTEPGGWPAGIAWLNGVIPGRDGSIQVWRLTLREGGALKGREHEVPGRWIVKDRQFVRLGDVADEV